MSKSTRKQKQPLMGNHQRCWIWGRHVIHETILAARWPIYSLYCADDLDSPEDRKILDLAIKSDIPLNYESRRELTKRCRSEDHQGFVGKMPPYSYTDLSELLKPKQQLPLILMFDRIQDSYNFGAMIRAAVCFSISGIIIGRKSQCEVNSQVVRSSAGSVNHISIAQVKSLSTSVELLKQEGFQIVGASEKASHSLFEAAWTFPAVCIIGNEATGIDPVLQRQCDLQIAIPQAGPVRSLNAAVSAGIFLYEAKRQFSRNVNQ